MSEFVIYNTKDFHLWCGNSYGAKFYATERAAKAQFTKLTKGMRAILKDEDWAIASYEDFQKIDPTVTVTSLMSGKPVLIKASQRGKCAVDPSMEGYWTM